MVRALAFKGRRMKTRDYIFGVVLFSAMLSLWTIAGHLSVLVDLARAGMFR